MNRDFGIQLYTVRDCMKTAAEIRDTFKKLREMGYTEAQTAGSAIPYKEFAEIAKETGLKIIGTHYGFEPMCDNFEETLEDHKALGTVNMGIGGFWFKTVEEIEEFIEKANIVAKKAAANGMKFTYHNHSHEFAKLDNGKTAMEMLIEGLDKDNTSFVLDTYWVQHGGGDVRYWIEKLAGRIDILHLKDMARILDVPNGQQVQSITEIGNGNLEWKAIIETAEKTGVKHFVVEQDTNWTPDPLTSAKISIDYLKSL